MHQGDVLDSWIGKHCGHDHSTVQTGDTWLLQMIPAWFYQYIFHQNLLGNFPGYMYVCVYIIALPIGANVMVMEIPTNFWEEPCWWAQPYILLPVSTRGFEALMLTSFGHSYMVNGKVTCRLCSSIQDITMTMSAEHWKRDSMGGLIGHIAFPMVMRTVHYRNNAKLGH